jgi:hypothetical protein
VAYIKHENISGNQYEADLLLKHVSHSKQNTSKITFGCIPSCPLDVFYRVFFEQFKFLDNFIIRSIATV